MTLPSAPRELVGADGQPRFGRYQGVSSGFAWASLAPPYRRNALWRQLRRKRWHFVALTTEELFCGMAIIDVGWGNSAFAYAFDRTRGEVVESFSPVGLPVLSAKVGACAGSPCHFHFAGRHIELEPHGDGHYVLRLSAGRFRIEAQYGGDARRLLAVGPVPGGGSVHATQKSGALALAGFVEASGRRYRLDGGVASFDYSNGLLGRRTEWRWASAHAPGIGINLQAGYFGAAENALWIDGRIIPLAEASFEIEESRRESAWRLRTGDGLLDLRFTPEGARRDDHQLVLASSRLTQRVGSFDGWVKAAPDAAPRQVTRLAGLTEDYWARW